MQYIQGGLNFIGVVETGLGREIATQAELDHIEKVFNFWRRPDGHISPYYAKEVIKTIKKGNA